MNALPLAFIRPDWLLFALPPLVMLWLYARLPEKSATAPGIADHLREALTVRQPVKRWIAPLPIALVALAILAIALAGPSWQRQETPLNQDEGVVILALDASESMQQQVGGMSSWQHALLKSRDLVAALPTTNVGIIAFAGSAHWVLPPSRDKQLLTYTLAGLSSLKMPVAGKYWQRIEQPLMALKVDVSSVVLLTDTPPVLDRSPWPMQTWLFGEQEESSDGILVSLSQEDVDYLVDNILRDLTRTESSAEQWRDDGYLFILPMGVLMLFWFRRGWSLAWSILLVCQLSFNAPQVWASNGADNISNWWFSGDQKGRYYFQQGRFDLAAQAFDDELWTAISFYQGGDFEQAALHFASLDTPYAQLMLGNALAQQDYLQRALSVYYAMGLDHPYRREVAQNIASIEQRLAERQQMTEAQQTDIDQKEEQQIIGQAAVEDPSQLIDSAMQDQLSGQDILNQQQLAERWMAHINTAVGDYLTALFALQAHRGKSDE